MSLKTKFLRMFIILRTFKKSIKKSKEYIKVTQQRGIEICKEAIKHKDSELRIDIVANKRYITVGDINIMIYEEVLDITNHLYHYHILVPYSGINEVVLEFDKENGRRCRKIEHENKINITSSLNNILEELKK